MSGNETPYTVALGQPGDLDLSTATMTVFNENGGAATAPCNLASGPGCPTFLVQPGGQPRLVIRVARYGTITGNVVGVDDPAPTATKTALPIGPPPNGSAVAATLVARDDGTCTTSAPAVTLQAVASGNGYVLQGPPGFYRIDATNPNYDPVLEVPPQDGRDLCVLSPFGIPVPLLGPQVYRIQNDVNRPFPDWRLLVKRSVVEITVRQDLVDPAGRCRRRPDRRRHGDADADGRGHRHRPAHDRRQRHRQHPQHPRGAR